MRIRPLTLDDAAEAADLAYRALAPLMDDPAEDAQAGAGQRRKRIAHLTELDAAGAWGAVDDDGRLTGLALALVREGLWGLSLLAVDPAHQSQGLGGALLDAALTYAEGTRGQLILSSTDPRAMRRYARAGFELRPAVAAAGIVDRASLPAPHPDVRTGTGDDLALTEPISRAVRGATHAPDIPNAIARGDALIVLGERGFALHRHGEVRLLAATDEEAATALLWASLAATPDGASASVDFLTAGQDWAIAVILESGLALSPDGPMFARGEVGPLRPYIPSGSYL